MRSDDPNTVRKVINIHTKTPDGGKASMKIPIEFKFGTPTLTQNPSGMRVGSAPKIGKPSLGVEQ